MRLWECANDPMRIKRFWYVRAVKSMMMLLNVLYAKVKWNDNGPRLPSSCERYMIAEDAYSLRCNCATCRTGGRSPCGKDPRKHRHCLRGQPIRVLISDPQHT